MGRQTQYQKNQIQQKTNDAPQQHNLVIWSQWPKFCDIPDVDGLTDADSLWLLVNVQQKKKKKEKKSTALTSDISKQQQQQQGRDDERGIFLL